MKKQARFLSFFMAVTVFSTSLLTFNMNAKAISESNPIIIPKGGSAIVDDGATISMEDIFVHNDDEDYEDATNVTLYSSSDMNDVIFKSEGNSETTFEVSSENMPNVSKWAVIDTGKDYINHDSTCPGTYHSLVAYPYSYDTKEFESGTSYLVASNNVLTGFDNFNVSIYYGDNLVGKTSSTNNFKFFTADELKATYNKKLEELGYNLPTITDVYYDCELVSSQENSCELKVTIEPTYKVTIKYPAVTATADDTYYVTKNIPVNIENLKFKEFKDYTCDGIIEDYYDGDVGEVVYKFSEDSVLHFRYKYRMPEYKVDTANRTISGLLPNTKLVDDSNDNIKFTADSTGKITYPADKDSFMRRDYFFISSAEDESEICRSEEFCLEKQDCVIPMFEKDGDGYKVANKSDFDGQNVKFLYNDEEIEDISHLPVSSDNDDTFATVYPDSDSNFETYVYYWLYGTDKLYNNSTDNKNVITEPYDQQFYGYAIDYCGAGSRDSYIHAESYSNNDKIGTATYMVNYDDDNIVGYFKYDYKISDVKEFRLDCNNSDKVFHAGSTQKLTTTLKGDNLRDNKIAYSVAGNTDPSTKVSSDGTLSVGENETAEALTIMADYTPMENKFTTLTLMNKPLKSQTISSDETNISISGSHSADARLIVTKLPESNSNHTALLKNAGNATVLGCYDISTTGEYDGDLTVSFNVGDKYNGKTLVLIHKKSDGTIEKFKSVAENGVVTFTVTSLSPFMLTTEPTVVTTPDKGKADTTTENTTNKVENPKTGSDLPIASTGILLIASAAVFFISKKSRK